MFVKLLLIYLYVSLVSLFSAKLRLLLSMLTNEQVFPVYRVSVMSQFTDKCGVTVTDKCGVTVYGYKGKDWPNKKSLQAHPWGARHSASCRVTLFIGPVLSFVSCIVCAFNVAFTHNVSTMLKAVLSVAALLLQRGIVLPAVRV